MALVIQNFSFRYPQQQNYALQSLSFSVPGGCCAVLGPTSAGKSTLLHVLAGAAGAHSPHAHAEGSITIAGATYAPMPEAILFPTVTLLLQDPAVQMSGFCETALEELQFSLSNAGVTPQQQQKRIEDVARQVHITPLLHRSVATLSGGELQRIAVATALVVQPRVLLLDEPVSALDEQSRSALSRLLRSLAPQSVVLFTDTGLDFAIATADYFLILDGGRTRFFGDRRSFFHNLHQFADVLPCDEWMNTVNRLRSCAQPRLRRFLPI